MTNKNIGSYVKLLRQTKELTQEQLAQKTGLSKSYISEIEQGNRTPHLEKIEKLSKVLEIPASIILLLSYGNQDIDKISNKIAKKELKRSMAKFEEIFKLSSEKHEPSEEVLFN